jgi:MFS family permease
LLPLCKKVENQEGFIANISGLVDALKSLKLWMFACVVGVCSAVGYLYSAAGPMIAQHQLGLSASEYGYWNCMTMFGMLLSGVSGAYLLKRLCALRLALCSMILILISLAVLALLNHFSLVNSVVFFAIASLLYLFGGWCFPAGASLAMQAISNKAHAASAKSFINMGSAALAVFILNGIHATRLHAFIGVLFVFVGVLGLMLVVYMLNNRNISAGFNK